MSEEIKRAVSVSELAKQLMVLDDLLASCMRCGLCQAVCPVYGATMKEADVSRGKIALVENLAHEIIKDVDGVSQRLDRCLLCGSCQANCPSGVGTMGIFLRARRLVVGYKGLNPVKKLIFRVVLPHPGLMNFFVRISSWFQNLFLRKVNKKTGTVEVPVLRPFVGKRHFQPLEGRSFSAKSGNINTPVGKSGIKVAFFPGCVPDKLFVRLSDATMKVLEKHGVGVFMPAGLACCGIPNLVSGDHDSFKRLVEINLKHLAEADFDYLVSPCATCASNIKENWLRFKEDFTSDEQRQIEKLHGQVMDITAFLVDVLKIDLKDSGAKAGARRVTYHDSCHMRKSLGVFTQPRAILKSLQGFQFVEMPEADRCCGSGGSFTLTQHALANQIGKRKRDNIVSVKPDIVAVGCPACMLQLMDMLSQNGDNVSVKHVVELYADSL
jgi:glycolate oxidase iron-sulfur subunit